MKYKTYTMTGYWEEKIYFFLNKIIKDKNNLYFYYSKDRGFDDERFFNNYFGELLKNVVVFYISRGDRILERKKQLPEFKFRNFEAVESTFYQLQKEIESRGIEENLKCLILSLWALKNRSIVSVFENFFSSLQEYAWDELNSFKIILPKKKKSKIAKLNKLSKKI